MDQNWFCVCQQSAIYAFTDSGLNNINIRKFLSENAKVTGWTILGSTTSRGRILHAFVQTQPPIQ
jgi:hypothetical protein